MLHRSHRKGHGMQRRSLLTAALAAPLAAGYVTIDDLRRVQRPRLAMVDKSPPPRPHRERQLLVPPPFVRSTLIGRPSPRRTPQQDAASITAFALQQLGLCE